MVEMIEPYKGKVYDPACGSGGMFVQSQHFIDDHRKELKTLGETDDVPIATVENDARHSEADIRRTLIENNLIYGILTKTKPSPAQKTRYYCG